MTVDHLIMNGELDNTEIFDLSEYPFTIKNQSLLKKKIPDKFSELKILLIKV